MSKEELVTILMLDVVGSMAMWESDQESASTAISRLEEIVGDCAARHHGRVHKSRGEGDSFFLTFESPGASIRASADLHRCLASETWQTPKPIQVRASIRTGECERRDGDLFGPTVNRCARMRGAANPGQFVVCEATHALVSNGKLESIDWIDLGVYTLRDAPAPERFFGLAVDGEAPIATRLAIGESELSNLPVRATGFIGREAELGKVETALRASRLVTLTGPGGSGKTRLAEVAADRFVGEMADGVWFVALAECRTPESVAGLIAKSVPQLRAADSGWDSVLAALQSKHLLIVLDNCEQLIPQLTPFVHRLLVECPRIRVLATSRKPFNLNEETVVPVPPFAVDNLYDATEKLEDQPAFALFWNRAKAKNPELKLDSTTANAIVSICQRLSGIPLALEQAASYAGRLTPVQIEERLRSRLSLLKSAPGTVEARHETMQSTIEWSIGLLSNSAKTLIFRLGVFSGGWTLDAAEAVAGDEIDAFEAHGELVDSSLVYWVDDEVAGRRYRFLEPIREFVLESGSIDAETLERYYAWLLGFAEQVDDEMVGAKQAEWMCRAEFEIENFRTALDSFWLAKDNRLPSLANSLRRFWFRAGLYRECATWIQKALELTSKPDPKLVATMLNALGACHSRLGETDLALKGYEESLEIWSSLDNWHQMAGVLTNMAILAADRKDFREARELYARSATLYQEAGDDRGLGAAIMNCSFMEILQGDWQAANETSLRSIDLLRRTKDLQNLAFALGNRAHALWELGEMEAFARCSVEQLDVIEQLHDPYPLGLALASIVVNGSNSTQFDVAKRALVVLDNLKGFEASGLGHETRRRLDDARCSLGQQESLHGATNELTPTEFQQSFDSARGVLTEFLEATCRN